MGKKYKLIYEEERRADGVCTLITIPGKFRLRVRENGYCELFNKPDQLENISIELYNKIDEIKEARLTGQKWKSRFHLGDWNIYEIIDYLSRKDIDYTKERS